MGLFRKNPCRMFYNDKTKKFNLKSFSVSFEEITGKKLSANLGEIDYQTIPPEISEHLRSQAEIHFQICNAIHMLRKGTPEHTNLSVKFVNHLMEMEKTLAALRADQKKTLVPKKASPNTENSTTSLKEKRN